MAHDDNNPGLFEDVNTQSLYTVANAVAWRRLDERPRQIPEIASHGIDVAKRPVAVVAAYCRKRMHHRTSWIEVVEVDDTATYTVTVDGNTVSHAASGGDGALEILQGLRDALNADATISGIITGDLIQRDPDALEDDTLRLRGDVVRNYSATVSTDTGASELSLEQEATSFEMTPFLWLRDTGPEGQNPDRWGHHPSVGIISVDWRGMTLLKVPVNAAQGLDFKVSGDDGTVYVFAGQAKLES